MKSNSTTALTLYPFLRQIKIRRSTAAAVTSGIDATGLPFMDHPSSTDARGIRLRVIGAFSFLCRGIMALISREGFVTNPRRDRINFVNLTRSSGCHFPST
jgi:hypothetical protein